MSKLNLLNWTMREARELSPEHHMHSEIEGAPPSFDDVLKKGERGEPSSEGIRAIDVRSVQLTVSSPAAPSPSYIPEVPDHVASFNLPNYAESAAPSVPAETPTVPMSPLLKAIVDLHSYSASADRERAIVLRWVLRDIKANRLKLSPIDPLDLRDLFTMGLVEMRNDAPVLTNAGGDAIV